MNGMEEQDDAGGMDPEVDSGWIRKLILKRILVWILNWIQMEVVEEEVISKEVLPLEITNLEVKPVERLEKSVLSSEEKAKIALQKTIERKKAEQKAKDDENQTKLF